MEIILRSKRSSISTENNLSKSTVSGEKGGLPTFIGYMMSRTISVSKGGEIVIVSGKFSLWIGLWLRLRFFYRDLHILGILHGSEVNLPGLLGKKFTHLSMMACNQLVAVSHYTASIIPAWIRKSKNISIIPNGIDCQRMDRKLTESVPLNLQRSPILLTVGGVTPRKGQHRVIRALPRLFGLIPKLVTISLDYRFTKNNSRS